MEKRKEQESRIKSIILSMDPDNKKCADCLNENVNFVSINNGTVLCSDCAEKHNHLSYWISYIKSFSEKWDDYLLKYIKNGGNSRFLKFCKDYKIENIKSLDRYKTKGVEYYRLILKSEVMGFDPPDNINVSSAGEILENIENNYPEFENYSFVKHVDLEKLEKQFEIDRKFNEENNAGILQTFQGILGNFGKKINEAKENFVGKVNEKLNEEGGIIDKMKDMKDGVKIKYYEFMGKNEEVDKIIKEKVKENERKNNNNNNGNNESLNKNIENISFNDLKELKEQKNKSLSGKKLNEIIKNENNENNENKNENYNENKKEEKLNENKENEEKIEKKIEKKEIITVEEKIIEKNEPIEKNKNVENKKEEIEIKKEEKIVKHYEDNKNEKKIIDSEKNVTNTENLNNQNNNNEHLEELQQKIEKKEEKTKLDEILKEENEEEQKMPSNPEEIKQKLDDIINEKEDNEKNKPYRKISKEIQKTQTIESNSDIFKTGTIRSVATSEMFLDENQLNEILGDDKEEEL